MFRQDTYQAVTEALHAAEYLAVTHDKLMANKPMSSLETLLVAQARFLWHLEHDLGADKSSRRRSTKKAVSQSNGKKAKQNHA